MLLCARNGATTLGPIDPDRKVIGAPMESPQERQLQVELERRLVDGLHRMRDTLTRLSLLLNDLKFEADVQQRQAAHEVAADCIARSRSPQQ